jgi:hypothetical protein
MAAVRSALPVAGLEMTVDNTAFPAAPWRARDRRRSCREMARAILRLIQDDCPAGMRYSSSCCS